MLTRNGRALLAEEARQARDTYRSLRFVQLEDFVRGDLLTETVRGLLPVLREHAVRVVKPPEVTTGFLRDGRRFERLDPGEFTGGEIPPAGRAAVQAAFDRGGLTAFVHELLAEAMPFFEDVAERRLRYDRTFLLSYREGDFIAPHGDTQTSRRVMIQMPVTFGCRSAMRVMRDGWMESYYDNPGALRIHGPGIWHEVLPVLRMADGPPPERILVTARLPYAADV